MQIPAEKWHTSSSSSNKLQSFAYLENGSFFARVETKSCSKLIILMQSQIAMCYMILSSLDEMKLWNVTTIFLFQKIQMFEFWKKRTSMKAGKLSIYDISQAAICKEAKCKMMHICPFFAGQIVFFLPYATFVINFLFQHSLVYHHLIN